MRATMRVGPLSHYELARLRVAAFHALKGWGTTGEDGKWRAWGWKDRCQLADELTEWSLLEGIADLPVDVITPMVEADLYGEQS